MKASKYNVFYPLEDKIVGYNTVSDNFLVLEPLLHDLYVASVNENVVQQLKDVHVDLYDILVDKGFIIETEIDELEKIKKISHETDFNEESFQLTINPTMNCNFKCWYCYETHIKDSKMSETTLTNIIKFVDNVLEEKKETLKRFTLEWFGGEPLLYFNKTVYPLLQDIYPKMAKYNINFSSGFTTNGLLINQDVLDKCKAHGVSNFQITLDGHRERHNQVRFVSKTKGSYDEIVANMKLCLKNELSVIARINISEETISDLLKIIDDFKDLTLEEKDFLTFSFHEVWQEEKNLTADISGIVDEFRRNELKSTYIGESNASIRNSCYADKLNHATVNYNGDVYKCTARDFESGSREGVLDEHGAITWNEKFQKRLYDTRFKNKPCLECKILPICNGGCSQHRMEHEGVDYCIHDFNEESKLQIIKEKFFSRMASMENRNQYNKTISRLLQTDFSQYPLLEPEIFQETLTDFFQLEVRQEFLETISDTNKIYAKSLKHLRKNEINTYLENKNQIDKTIESLNLNTREKKVASLFALPVIAYYYYKQNDFNKSLDFTNDSILNDDYFLEEHPFLYGHKIQQLHNTIRVNFKADRIEEACKICDDVLCHLIYGREIQYKVGTWYKKYNLNDDIPMIGMVYQIFSETVKVIADLSNTSTKENLLYSIAFNSLFQYKDTSGVHPQLLPIIDFLKLKFDILDEKGVDETELNNWIDDILESDFAYFGSSLFYSLFASMGVDSFVENKKEFKKVYS